MGRENIYNYNFSKVSGSRKREGRAPLLLGHPDSLKIRVNGKSGALGQDEAGLSFHWAEEKVKASCLISIVKKLKLQLWINLAH